MRAKLSGVGGATTSQRGGIIFKLMFLVFLVVLGFFIYIARRPLMRLAGGFWVVDETPKPSDVIVMLSDDNYQGDRAARAAELFKAGLAPRVIASGLRLQLCWLGGEHHRVHRFAADRANP